MATVTTKPMTAEEFFLTEEPEPGRYELVQGEIVSMPPPGLRHGEVQMNVGFAIKAYLLTNRIGRVVTESGAVVERDPDTVRGPDVSYYSQERLPFGKEVVAYHDEVPDLVAEVVSPDDTKKELKAKVREYLAAGVRVVWVVDPDDRTVTVFTEPTKSTVLEADATLTCEGVLPGFACRVADLFA